MYNSLCYPKCRPNYITSETYCKPNIYTPNIIPKDKYVPTSNLEKIKLEIYNKMNLAKSNYNTKKIKLKFLCYY